MRIELSNGLFLDPCNPALLYDKPEEEPKPIQLTEQEEKEQALERRLSKIESAIDSLSGRER